MRPGQNKRLRGRNNGRKGPNPLTRSFESNGPDVKIRGTAQHVAEKYLQLARDAQSSGDIVMAESLLQHAEHYFRLIAAAQQATNNFGRQSFEAEDDSDDDDDFTGIPDRFAPLADRLPVAPAAPYQAPPPYQAPQPQVQPHFAPPQPQPQPFEERPYGEARHERPNRPERPPFNNRGRGPDRNQDRNYDRGQDRPQPERNPDRGGETNDRGQHSGFERNRDRNRFQPRQERYEAPVVSEQPPAPDLTAPVGLPAFITAPVPPRPVSVEAPPSAPEQAPGEAQEDTGFHLAPRRRRRPRPAPGEAGGPEEAPLRGELPLGD